MANKTVKKLKKLKTVKAGKSLKVLKVSKGKTKTKAKTKAKAKSKAKTKKVKKVSKASKASKASKKQESLIFGDGPLDKATLIFLNSSGKKTGTLPVQFNPTEYAIARTIEYKKLNGIGQEIHPLNTQPIKGELAKLTVTVFADVSTTPKESSTPKKFKSQVDKNMLAKFCKRLGKMTKYNHEDHVPESLEFSWGSLQFVGNVVSANTTYQMFSREGKPVKVKIELTIEGEEKSILKDTKANPNESPDRTKFRNLGQVDELWMLAYDEYGDTGSWKVIAKENGVLNPRKMDHANMLKVPSI